MNSFRMLITPALSGKSITRLLSERIKGLNRNRLEVAYHRGLILLNGKVVSSDRAVQQGDLLEADLDFFVRSKVFPEKLPLEILFEDDHLLVVNKPPGMACHAGLGIYKGTLLNALAHHFSMTNAQAIENGLVQRLDRQTRGLMVVAKSACAFQHLKNQVDTRKLSRAYIAEAWGAPKESSGIIQAAIGRMPGNESVIGLSPAGKEAITAYRVLETKKESSTIECLLHTGRTHQIRIHLSAFLGCPLLGDKRYGIAEDTTESLHLCSYRIAFTHPVSGKKMQYALEAPFFV
jgi:23S rRNA pseudouridine1911/1915/1917 synthase